MGNLDIGFYFSLFRKRLPHFAVVAAIVAAIGVTFTFAWPLSFRATAKILVESPQIPTELARSTVPTSTMEQFQIIQEDVLSRPSLLDLARRREVYRDIPNLSQTSMAEDMESRIAIEPMQLESAGGGSAATVFQISFRAPDPRLAADVVNDLVSMILRKDVELRTGRATYTVQFFTQELSRLGGALKSLDQQILQFKNDNINALPDSLEFRRSQQSALELRLLLLVQEEASLNRRKVDLRSRRFAGGAINETTEGQDLVDLRKALSEQLGVFSEESPTITTLRGRIAALEAQLRNSDADGEVTDAPMTLSPEADIELRNIEDQLQAVAQQDEAIHRSLEELSISIMATPANETALNSLERDHQNLQVQYDAAVARLAEASTGQQIELHLKGERLSLIESAIPPQSPVSPKRALLLLGTLAAALGAALAVVLAPEFLNNRIRRPVELVTKLDIHPMATIPYIAVPGEAGLSRARRALPRPMTAPPLHAQGQGARS